jgi:transcription termination/antitermination protein NusG
MTATPIAAQIVDDAPKSDKLKWYVVHTYSGFENKVKLALLDTVRKVSPLQPFFGDIVIPMETVEEVKTEEKGGKTVTKRRQVKRRAAPGYIFVQMEMKPETWQMVKNTPKVTGFIGAPNVKSAMQETDLKRIPSVPERQVLAMTQQLVETASKPSAKVDFDVGDTIRVTDGNFANFTGAVSEVNHAKQKVRVTITIFGRGTPVELEFNQVTKA